MHRGRLAATAGVAAYLAFSMTPGRVWAAEPDTWLYVVNASAHPMVLVIDDEHLELPVRSSVTRPMSAGGHGLAAVIGVRTASQYSAFDPATAGVDKGRSYWCFVGGESRGAPQLIAVAPADCAALVRAGEAPMAPPPVRPAPPLAR